MLTCIPPKSSGDIYVGASSGYKPAKVIYDDKPAKIAVTTNSDISTWDTNADIVLDRSTDKVYFLDKAGCVTEDATQAKSIYWAEPAKGGHGITYYQQPYNASQAYQQGDLVEKGGWVYRSNKNDNVWSPELRLDELWSEIARLEAEEKIHSRLINYTNNILPPSWWNK